MAKCSICGKAIKLQPSAAERARRYGGKASDYTKLFRQHADCLIKQRSAESVELMGRMHGGQIVWLKAISK